MFAGRGEMGEGWSFALPPDSSLNSWGPDFLADLKKRHKVKHDPMISPWQYHDLLRNLEVQ